MDKGNIEKNKQHNIESPQPIPSFQALISGIITPKISAITQTFGSLSSGVLGGSSGSSSSGSFGGHASGDASGGSAAGGLGGILSSVLKLSGPILSASIGGGAGASSGGGASASFGADSTTEADDDF